MRFLRKISGTRSRIRLSFNFIERDVVLVIGHPQGQTERWIEILIRAMASGDKKVFHAMDLGPKYRPFLEEV